jgi:hypothetical protein
MEELWSFAKAFLNLFPEGVKGGVEGSCAEIDGGSLFQGITLKRVRFPSNTSGAAVLRNFISRLEDEEQMMEVLNAPAEVFRDEDYSRHDFSLPPHMSYFT